MYWETPKYRGIGADSCVSPHRGVIVRPVLEDRRNNSRVQPPYSAAPSLQSLAGVSVPYPRPGLTDSPGTRKNQ